MTIATQFHAAGEAHEVVVVRLLSVVRVTEHRGDDDDDHHDDGDRLRAKRQVHRHEERGQERPRQVVDEIVDDTAVKPRDGLADTDLTREGAVDSVHDEGDDEATATSWGCRCPRIANRASVAHTRPEIVNRCTPHAAITRPRLGFLVEDEAEAASCSCVAVTDWSGTMLLVLRVVSAPQYAKSL